jgi:CPA2 family monovalent cation:H+ antiporter-2
VEWDATALHDHAVLVGHGRVGSLVAGALQTAGQPYLVIEERQDIVERLRAAGVEAVLGSAGEPGLLDAANLKGARWFISAVPNPFENGNLIEQARAANPDLRIVARARSDAEVEHIRRLGASLVVTGEREIARAMADYILEQPGPAPTA